MAGPTNPSAFPDPVNPDDLGRGPLIMGITWTFTAISLFALGLRFWVRITLTKLIHVEDWLMLLAGLFNLASQSIATVSFHWGLGKHDLDLTFEQRVNLLKYVWIQTVPGVLSSIVARISICALLIRIFGTKIWFKWFLIVATTLQAVSAFLLIILNFVVVRPIEGRWNPTIEAKRMDPSIPLYTAYTAGSLLAFGDLAYVLLPVMIVWKLKMPLRRKLGLCILLGLSLFTMSIAIVKVIGAQGRPKAGNTDVLYRASLSVVWALIEQSFVIALGCVPPLTSARKLKLGPLVSFPSTLGKLVRSFGKGYGSGSGDSTGELGQYSDAAYYELGGGKSKSEVQAGKSVTSTLDKVETQSAEAGRIRQTQQYTVTREQGEDVDSRR